MRNEPIDYSFSGLANVRFVYAKVNAVCLVVTGIELINFLIYPYSTIYTM